MLFRYSRIFGLILVIIGAGLLLNSFHVRVFVYLWPIVLIAAGLLMIAHCRCRGTSAVHIELDNAKFFGDTSRSDFSGEIDGASISHFVGDIRLNLSGAVFKPGENHLKLAAFVGDIELTVPSSVAVWVNCSGFVADVLIFDRREDGMLVSCSEKTADYDSAERKLKINCSVFVGDIRITRGK